MANDKLFQKRKSREKKTLVEKRRKREENRRFLIVCEGQTETAYFQHYVHRQEGLVADITYDCGTSPCCVTQCAIDKAKVDGDYDKAFAVFDGDTADTANFERALTLAETAEENAITTIPSTPCFEYWLLLHFQFSRKPYLGIKNAKSAGTQILSELKKCSGMNTYRKGETLNFPAFAGKLSTAIKNAERAKKEALSDNERNPSTDAHILIKAIQSS